MRAFVDTAASFRFSDQPGVAWLLADRGFDAGRFREVVEAIGIAPQTSRARCIAVQPLYSVFLCEIALAAILMFVCGSCAKIGSRSLVLSTFARTGAHCHMRKRLLPSETICDRFEVSLERPH
jgi:hypothetical protein